MPDTVLICAVWLVNCALSMGFIGSWLLSCATNSFKKRSCWDVASVFSAAPLLPVRFCSAGWLAWALGVRVMAMGAVPSSY